MGDWRQVPGSSWWRYDITTLGSTISYAPRSYCNDQIIRADSYRVTIKGGGYRAVNIPEFVVALQWAQAQHEALKRDGEPLPLGFETSPEQRVARIRGR